MSSGIKAETMFQMFVESKAKILSWLKVRSTVEILFSLFSRKTFGPSTGREGETTLLILFSISSGRKFEMLAHRPIIGHRQETIVRSAIHSSSTHHPLTVHSPSTHRSTICRLPIARRPIGKEMTNLYNVLDIQILR